MKTEFEIVFTSIEREKVCEEIKKVGGKCVKVNTLMKRVIFKNPENPEHSYVRVRDEGGKITCCMKTVAQGNLHIESVKELETRVHDFDVMKNIFLGLGLKQKSYQETYREIWEIHDEVEIMIDEWPGIKPFIEIEGETEAVVRKYTQLLGFDYEDGLFGTVDQIYLKEKGFDPDYINTLPEITFENPPKK